MDKKSPTMSDPDNPASTMPVPATMYAAMGRKRRIAMRKRSTPARTLKKPLPRPHS